MGHTISAQTSLPPPSLRKPSSSSCHISKALATSQMQTQVCRTCPSGDILVGINFQRALRDSAKNRKRTFINYLLTSGENSRRNDNAVLRQKHYMHYQERSSTLRPTFPMGFKCTDSLVISPLARVFKQITCALSGWPERIWLALAYFRVQETS